MRTPDVFFAAHKGEGSPIFVVTDVGGLFRPCTVLIRTFTETAREDCALMLKSSALELGLWDGDPAGWDDSRMGMLIDDVLGDPGHARHISRFETGFACRMVAIAEDS